MAALLHRRAQPSLPYYVTHMWMATYDNGLATAYGPCKVTALAADRVPVEIVCRTDYPFNETIEIAVKPAARGGLPALASRSRLVQEAGDGGQRGRGPGEGRREGFVRVERTWKAGDTISLRFPMAVEVATGGQERSRRALRHGFLWAAALRAADR